jgi:hypothetical protein
MCVGDYSGALAGFGQMIVSQLKGCVTHPFADPMNPVCTVRDLLDADDSIVDELPACEGNAPPCWKYLPDDACPDLHSGTNFTQGRIAISRDPSATPPNTHLSITCRGPAS